MSSSKAAQAPKVYRGWQSPAPRIGSKAAYAAEVVGVIKEFQPHAIALPFAGFGKELIGLSHTDFSESCALTVADSDAAIRALWTAAHQGRLDRAALRAANMWARLLDAYEKWTGVPDMPKVRACSSEEVWAAWCKLRSAEVEGEAALAGADEYAAWTIAVAAGANCGGWRRNPATGAINTPYAPATHPGGDRTLPKRRDPEWLLRGIYGGYAVDGPRAARWREKTRAAEFAFKQMPVWIASDYAPPIVHALQYLSKGRRVCVSIDPPYGTKHGTQGTYACKWLPRDAVDLRDRVQALLDHPRRDNLRLVMWIGATEISNYAPAAPGGGPLEPRHSDGVTWVFKPGRTSMKATTYNPDGSIKAKAKMSTGAWYGRSWE